MNFKIEYEAKIIEENDTLRYFLQYIDSRMTQQTVEISKIVFLQFFGVHSHAVNSNHFFIIYKKSKVIVEQEMSKQEYRHYKSFKSLQIRESSIYDRYIEHMELNEFQLYKRFNNLYTSAIDIIYQKDLIDALYIAISELPSIQQRRLVLHYFNGYSLSQIAKIECRSKSSIQCSINSAIHTLKEKILAYRPYD